MKDCMIDLETYGNGPDAVIVQVGAVYFDRETGKTGYSFQANIDPSSAVKAGRVIDPSTMEWWMQQSSHAQQSVMAEPRLSHQDSMAGLAYYLGDAENVWSHATFDFVIVAHALKQAGLKPPGFRSARDIRTLLDISGISPKDFTNDGVPHVALDDAIFQVKYTVAALQKIKLALSGTP